jgi:TolB-like protein/Tfp pilus assembly protein PilF
MGEVYRATDSKLGREVALKVLPPDMARDPERLVRFQREARAVAALNHPHIVTIYSVEESDGVHFLTMELVEGQSLDHRIPEGGLPVEQIVEIASALADALAAAHDKGIVHRDLKPANVMVTEEGRVKVLDFGLAKETRAGNSNDATMTSAGHTEVGVVMGTPRYMSPEQIAGRALDHRTDIFSLGVMLYEMSTGRPPFAATSSAELASAILRDIPPPVTVVRANLPAGLARIIQHCLEKNAAERFQSARDVRNELRSVNTVNFEMLPLGTLSTSGSRPATKPDSGAARAEGGFWVAVLPFKYSGSRVDLTALAEGLSEDIVTGLSRFSYLKVIARNSTLRYASEAVDVRSTGKDLGARYLLEGSLRQAGTRLRIAAQLVDTISGVHLWAETYDRPFDAEAVFELQDDVAPRIVSTIADMNGILVHSMSEVLRSRAPDQLTPYEALLRSFSYYERLTAEEHAAATAALEYAVQQAPNYADCWAVLSMLYGDEFKTGFNVRPDSLDRALAAARRAVELAPSNHLAPLSLASVLFFRKEHQAFRSAAERAIALNPLDGGTTAFLGMLMACSGDWERGCALVERAMQLNSHHLGWYWCAAAFNAYRKSDYRGALDIALKINTRGVWGAILVLVAAQGQLGEREAARDAVHQLLALMPDFAGTAREECAKWWEPQLVEHLLDGLRKAGLEVAGEKRTEDVAPAADSGAARAEEGFWVAVLPFKFSGANAEFTALAEGFTEDIVTGLSRFSYLRVISRSSTSRYANEAVDVRSAGKQLGARYVMEGSIRQAGSTLRIAVQLVDASSGAHLWAETYDRPFNADRVFELQDDIVPRIVSTAADMNGILPRSMSELLRSRAPDQLTPYEAVLRTFSTYERLTAGEHGAARAALERAVQQAPGSADCWAMLSMIYGQEYRDGFNVQPDPLGRSLAAARRAVELAPSNHLAPFALASVQFFRKERQTFRSSAERAIALNPMDGGTTAFLGMLTAYSGDWERGCAMVERAMQLNSHHLSWYWFPFFFNAYRKGDYQGALNFALKINTAGFFFTYIALAAVYGKLGQADAAREAARELLALRPDFVATAREEFEKWWEPQFIEDLLDGLRKAGLEIDGQQSSAVAVHKNPESPEAPPTLERIEVNDPSKSQDSSSQTPTVIRSEAEESSERRASGIKRHAVALAIAVNVLLIGSAIVMYWKASATSGIDSIAVLPLENRSNDPDSDYISDGITESINNSLARLPSLKVIPHSVAFHYKGKATDVRKVGDELRVQSVLAGSVAQRGNDLTIDVELDDVRNGKQLWGEQYHRKLADLLAVQADIAREVSQRLRSQFSAEDQKNLTKGSTNNPKAYQLYLKGKYYTNKLSKDGFGKGIDYFNQAIAVDPSYGLAYSGLAYNYINQDDWFLPPNESAPKTKTAAERALSIDSSDADAHLSLALVAQWYEWNWAATEREFERAIELNPNDAAAHNYYAFYLGAMRRNDQALAEAKRGQQADPLSSLANGISGSVLVFAKQWDLAIDQLHSAIEIDSNFWFDHCYLGRAYQQKGRLPEAMAEFQRAVDLEKYNSETWSALGYAYAVLGNRAEAQKILDHLKELATHSWVAPYNVAIIYVGLGEKEKAFDLL